MTIMIYLREPEDGGETAFPAADNITYSDAVSISLLITFHTSTQNCNVFVNLIRAVKIIANYSFGLEIP